MAIFLYFHLFDDGANSKIVNRIERSFIASNGDSTFGIRCWKRLVWMRYEFFRAACTRVCDIRMRKGHTDQRVCTSLLGLLQLGKVCVYKFVSL